MAGQTPRRQSGGSTEGRLRPPPGARRVRAAIDVLRPAQNGALKSRAGPARARPPCAARWPVRNASGEPGPAPPGAVAVRAGGPEPPAPRAPCPRRALSTKPRVAGVPCSRNGVRRGPAAWPLSRHAIPAPAEGGPFPQGEAPAWRGERVSASRLAER